MVRNRIDAAPSSVIRLTGAHEPAGGAVNVLVPTGSKLASCPVSVTVPGPGTRTNVAAIASSAGKSTCAGEQSTSR